MIFSALLPSLLLCLPLPISAVDITLSLAPPEPNSVPDFNPGAVVYPQNNPANPWAGGNVIARFLSTDYQRCTNKPPGECCKPRPPPANLPPEMAAIFPQPHFRRVIFTSIGHSVLAIAWVPRGHVSGCYGIPKETHWGGGSWVYDLPAGDADTRLSGANYIRLPPKVPPEPTDSPWLWAEGMLAAVWGRGGPNSFFTGTPAERARANLLAAAERQLQGSSGFGGGMRKRREKRTPNGNIISAQKGVIFCKEPTQAAWADTIVLNGTEFKAEGPGSDIYRSVDGATLDFTVPAG